MLISNHRPFEWRVWLAMLSCIPIFLVAMGLADRVFYGRANWPKLTGFTLRSVFMEPTHWYPQQTVYHKLFSSTWLIAFFILGQSYSGRNVSYAHRN